MIIFRLNPFIITVALVVLIAITGSYFLCLGTATPHAQGDGGGDFSRSDRSITNLSGSNQIDHHGQGQARSVALTEMKQKWANFWDKKGTVDNKKLHAIKVELSVESAERLLTGLEMIELLKFLDFHEAKSEARFVRLQVEKLFETEEPDVLLSPLLKAISLNFSKIDGPYQLDLMKWSYLMGKNATLEGFERFKDEEIDPWPLGDFMHGWATSKALDDPEGSFSMLVDFIEEGGKGSKQDQALEDVIRSFPTNEEIDFDKLESSLPIGGNANSAKAYENARRAILVEWANKDPADAVNHIIDNSDRIPVQMVTYVVEQAIKDMKFDGIEWVKEFPPGPHYDAAATAVVQTLWGSHPDVAKEWAMSIGDESLRQDQLENIQTIQRRKSLKEK